MNKKIVFTLLILMVLAVAIACNPNNSHENTASNNDMNSVEENDTGVEMASDSEQADSDAGNQKGTAEKDSGDATSSQSDRMVIYTADMTITIQDFQKAQNQLESLVADAGGFIVNSNVSTSDEGNQEGQLTARIPEEKFDGILDQILDLAKEVKERNVNGEDVTKEYVDLESRLKAKKEVKKRLEDLLDEASDTDDLLDVSNQLGQTQEEIESIKGEMEYLESHSAMSTLNISMQEDDVAVGDVKKSEDLNTWEKTKQALVSSTNAIMTFFSGVVIFLIGYSPILVPILVIAAVIFWLYRRRKKQ